MVIGGPGELLTYFRQLPADRKTDLVHRYEGEQQIADNLRLSFDRATIAGLSALYDRAIDHAKALWEAGRSVLPVFDFEISIDETEIETGGAAHYYLASELTYDGIPFTSIAPRFTGEFQKGIDYIGDVSAFAKDFAVHARIANGMGHKLSVHSGSDKFSVYPIICRQQLGSLHVKTSVTSWLIALQTVSWTNPSLFRELYSEAFQVFPTARTYYHVTPSMSKLTGPEKLVVMPDRQLEELFSSSADRQVMHVAYGELRKNENLWSCFLEEIASSQGIYHQLLSAHIGRHIELLEG